MNERVLKLESLTKQYKDCLALNQVSFTLEPAHIYGFVGNNGSGKSTLFRILAGLIAPTSGRVELFGVSDPGSIRKARSRIGFLFDQHGFQESMTATQNLISLQILRGYQNKNEARQLLELLGMEGYKADKERVRYFSLGEQQRCAMAGALLNDPELLILDEPLNGLDPQCVRLFRTLIQQENREKGKTVFLSSHNLEELYKLATDYLFISHGKLLQSISHEALVKKMGYHILLSTDNPEQAIKVIQEVLPDSVCHMTDNRRLCLDNPTCTAVKLRMALEQRQITVAEVSTVGCSLEDYYLSLVEESAI